MIARGLRRTIGRKASTQRFAPAAAGPVEMAVVVAVEPGDGTPGSAYATVELADGTTTTLAPVSGYLPAVGDQVPTVANGDDPVHFATRHMVDGDLQSRTFVEGVSGWRITAGGDAELNTAVIRGEVTAETFRTAVDPTIEGSVEVTSTEGVGRMIFRSPGLLQPAPAGISSPNPETLALLGPAATATLILGHEGGAYLGAGSGPIELSAPGFDVIVNGVSLTDPPRRSGDRASATVSIASGSTPTTIICATTYGTDAGGLVAFDPVTGGFTPQVPGTYQARITGQWEAGATYSASVGFRRNTTDTMMPASAQGVGLGTGDQKVFDFICNGSTDTIYPRVLQASGSAKNFLLTHFQIRRIHA